MIYSFSTMGLGTIYCQGGLLFHQSSLINNVPKYDQVKVISSAMYQMYCSTYQQNNLIMNNSFTLDLNRSGTNLFPDNTTIQKDAETLDSGLATASQFRRYPREEVMQQIEPGTNLRQMRHKKKLLEEQYKRISCRLQFQRNRDQKVLSKALNEQSKLYDVKYHEQRKREEQKRTLEYQERDRFQQWVKGQEVDKLRKKIQTGRRESLAKQQSRKKREIQKYQRKFNSQKCCSQKMRRESLQQTKLNHDIALKMKQQQKLKKRFHFRKRLQLQETGLIDKIERYGQETAKTMRLIGEMREKEEELERRNKSYGRVLMNILDNFKKLESF